MAEDKRTRGEKLADPTTREAETQKPGAKGGRQTRDE